MKEGKPALVAWVSTTTLVERVGRVARAGKERRK
ncbi:hypothetical protein ES703_66467 [subsurface metagenome]